MLSKIRSFLNYILDNYKFILSGLILAFLILLIYLGFNNCHHIQYYVEGSSDFTNSLTLNSYNFTDPQQLGLIELGYIFDSSIISLNSLPLMMLSVICLLMIVTIAQLFFRKYLYFIGTFLAGSLLIMNYCYYQTIYISLFQSVNNPEYLGFFLLTLGVFLLYIFQYEEGNTLFFKINKNKEQIQTKDIKKTHTFELVSVVLFVFCIAQIVLGATSFKISLPYFYQGYDYSNEMIQESLLSNPCFVVIGNAFDFKYGLLLNLPKLLFLFTLGIGVCSIVQLFSKKVSLKIGFICSFIALINGLSFTLANQAAILNNIFSLLIYLIMFILYFLLIINQNKTTKITENIDVD